MSTNVAETSLTIEGITAVVDSGLARSLSFDPHVGMDRLQLTPISQASADQRAGRAGRTQPGVCLRLWAERTHRLRPAGDEPEIRRLDLAGPMLELRVWGESDLQAFPWFEAPPAASLEQADALLKRLGALDAAGNVTPLGSSMARLPVSPRLARMLLEGDRLGQPEAVALAAALLSERDPFGRGEDALPHHRPAAADSDSDVYDRVAALEEFEESGRADSPLGRIHRSTAQFVLHVRDQLLRELRQAVRRAKPSPRRPHSSEVRRRSNLDPAPDVGQRLSGPARPCGAGCWPRFPIGWCGGAAPAAALDGWSAAGACAWSNPAPSAMRRCFWRWTSIAAGRKPWSARPRPSSAIGCPPIGSPCGPRSSSTQRAVA